MWPLLFVSTRNASFEGENRCVMRQTTTTWDIIQGGDLPLIYPLFSLVTIFARSVYHQKLQANINQVVL